MRFVRGVLSTYLARHVRLATGGVFLTRRGDHGYAAVPEVEA